MIIFNGCATVVRNPNILNDTKIKEEGKSLVLLRFSAEIDSGKVQGQERFLSVIASIDAGQFPKMISLMCLHP